MKDVIDVKDAYGKWYQAEVVELDLTSDRVLVHYHGWNARWDEWISRTSERFAPRGTRTASKDVPKERGGARNRSPGAESSSSEAKGAEGRGNRYQFVRMLSISHNHHVTDAFMETVGEIFCWDSKRGVLWSLSADGTLEQRVTAMNTACVSGAHTIIDTARHSPAQRSEAKEDDLTKSLECNLQLPDVIDRRRKQGRYDPQPAHSIQPIAWTTTDKASALDACIFMVEQLRCLSTSQYDVWREMNTLFCVIEKSFEQYLVRGSLSGGHLPTQKHAAFATAALALLRDYIWNAAKLSTIVVMASPGDSKNNLLLKIADFVETLLGISVQRVGEPKIFTGSRHPLLAVDSVLIECCGVLSEGFEMFYPSWSLRLVIYKHFADLTCPAYYAEVRSGPDLSIYAGPQPSDRVDSDPNTAKVSQQVISMLGEKYRQGFVGVRGGVLFADGRPEDLVSPQTAAYANRLIEQLSAMDKRQVRVAISAEVVTIGIGTRSSTRCACKGEAMCPTHAHSYLLLIYISQVYTLFVDSHKDTSEFLDAAPRTKSFDFSPFFVVVQTLFDECVELLKVSQLDSSNDGSTDRFSRCGLAYLIPSMTMWLTHGFNHVGQLSGDHCKWLVSLARCCMRVICSLASYPGINIDMMSTSTSTACNPRNDFSPPRSAAKVVGKGLSCRYLMRLLRQTSKLIDPKQALLPASSFASLTVVSKLYPGVSDVLDYTALHQALVQTQATLQVALQLSNAAAAATQTISALSRTIRTTRRDDATTLSRGATTANRAATAAPGTGGDTMATSFVNNTRSRNDTTITQSVTNPNRTANSNDGGTATTRAYQTAFPISSEGDASAPAITSGSRALPLSSEVSHSARQILVRMQQHGPQQSNHQQAEETASGRQSSHGILDLLRSPSAPQQPTADNSAQHTGSQTAHSDIPGDRACSNSSSTDFEETSAPSPAAPHSKTSTDRSGGNQAKPQLVLLADRVFSLLFDIFATHTYSDLPGFAQTESGARDQRDYGRIGGHVPCMSIGDFVRYRQHCVPVGGTLITKEDRPTIAVFQQYQRGGVLYRKGFLALHRDACLVCPMEVLNQLRVLEYRYDFLKADRVLVPPSDSEQFAYTTPSGPHTVVPDRHSLVDGYLSVAPVCLMENLEFLYAAMLKHLFAAPVSRAISQNSIVAPASDFVVDSTEPTPADAPTTGLPTMEVSHTAVVDSLDAKDSTGSHEQPDQPLVEEDVCWTSVSRLLLSEARSCQHPRFKQYTAFLEAFVYADPFEEGHGIQLPSTRRRSDNKSERKEEDNATLTRQVGSLSPPACMGLLLCIALDEMGGGLAARKHLYAHKPAVYSERAYAAACVKLNGLGETCLDFAKSVDIVRLLIACQTKRQRCIFSSLTPLWFKNVVRSVFKDVRIPMLELIRQEKNDKVQPPSTQGLRSLVSNQLTGVLAPRSPPPAVLGTSLSSPAESETAALASRVAAHGETSAGGANVALTDPVPSLSSNVVPTAPTNPGESLAQLSDAQSAAQLSLDRLKEKMRQLQDRIREQERVLAGMREKEMKREASNTEHIHGGLVRRVTMSPLDLFISQIMQNSEFLLCDLHSITSAGNSVPMRSSCNGGFFDQARARKQSNHDHSVSGVGSRMGEVASRDSTSDDSTGTLVPSSSAFTSTSPGDAKMDHLDLSYTSLVKTGKARTPPPLLRRRNIIVTTPVRGDEAKVLLKPLKNNQRSDFDDDESGTPSSTEGDEDDDKHLTLVRTSSLVSLIPSPRYSPWKSIHAGKNSGTRKDVTGQLPPYDSR